MTKSTLILTNPSAVAPAAREDLPLPTRAVPLGDLVVVVVLVVLNTIHLVAMIALQRKDPQMSLGEPS